MGGASAAVRESVTTSAALKHPQPPSRSTRAAAGVPELALGCPVVPEVYTSVARSMLRCSGAWNSCDAQVPKGGAWKLGLRARTAC